MKTNLVGKTFGRLKVESFSHFDSKYRYNHWNCLCECGEKTIVSTTSLMRKNRPTESCGCLRRDRLIEKGAHNKDFYGKANLNILFNTYKKSAKSREISFDLNIEDFSNLIKQNCFYCLREPSQKVFKKETNGPLLYNGLDRIDSSLSYTKENIAPCCKTCNYAKREMSLSDFKNWIIKVYSNLINKE